MIKIFIINGDDAPALPPCDIHANDAHALAGALSRRFVASEAGAVSVVMAANGDAPSVLMRCDDVGAAAQFVADLLIIAGQDHWWGNPDMDRLAELLPAAEPVC